MRIDRDARLGARDEAIALAGRNWQRSKVPVRTPQYSTYSHPSQSRAMYLTKAFGIALSEIHDEMQRLLSEEWLLLGRSLVEIIRPRLQFVPMAFGIGASIDGNISALPVTVSDNRLGAF